VNKLRKERRQSSAVAYFNCDYRDPRQRNTITILGGLLKCLAQQSKDFAAELMNSFGAKCRSHVQSDGLSIDDLKGSFSTISRHFKDVIVLIDALDEANDRVTLLCFLRELVLITGRNFKLLVTSRREADIEADFGGFPSVELNEATSKADVRIYISAQIESRVQKGLFRLHDNSLKDTIISHLVQHSAGL
jgi:hypothetical protein